MPIDDDDLNFDDMSDDENDEFEQNEKRRRNHPLFLKAKEILGTIDAMGNTMDEEDREMYFSTLAQSAMIIPAKIAGALGSENWLICMQNAAIIRDHAHYLLISSHGLRSMTKTDKKYIKVLRTEMEEFREMFKEWVGTFETLEKDDYEDEWGLFLRK